MAGKKKRGRSVPSKEILRANWRHVANNHQIPGQLLFTDQPDKIDEDEDSDTFGLMVKGSYTVRVVQVDLVADKEGNQQGVIGDTVLADQSPSGFLATCQNISQLGPNMLRLHPLALAKLAEKEAQDSDLLEDSEPLSQAS